MLRFDCQLQAWKPLQATGKPVKVGDGSGRLGLLAMLLIMAHHNLQLEITLRAAD